MKIIDDYLNEILYVQLKETGMPYRFIKLIFEDIRKRMMSCLYYWNQDKMRKAILFLSLEEALFYEPKGKAEIREFVVTAIRNSMLEVAASDNCVSLKINEPLTDEQIKKITSEAIRYFSNYNLSALANEIDLAGENVYTDAMDKYPLAWKMIRKLANLSEFSVKLKNMEAIEKKETLSNNINVKSKTVVCDGFTLEFDEDLKNMLESVVSGNLECFYSDCFKMVSRNFEKVLHVLQIILENDKIFCTSNYYISLECLEKRKKILRAAHNTSDAVKKMNEDNAPPMIQNCIKIMRDGKID